MLKKVFSEFELDLQLAKLEYLRWGLEYHKEPPKEKLHILTWYDQFNLVNSRLGRWFSISPMGSGVRGISKSVIGTDNESDNSRYISLKIRLTLTTGIIRNTIRQYLKEGDIKGAKTGILNWYMLKLGPHHELLFDRIQYGRNQTGRLTKGRWGLDESEKWTTLTGIRNRLINVVRYGEDLQDVYVRNLDKRLPGFSRNSFNKFLSAGMTWNKYAVCAFDCGPVLWSRSGFVDFNMVKERMNKLGWPYQSTAYQILKPLYHIALDYRKPPVRLRQEPDEGYSLDSMRRRKKELLRLINRIRKEIEVRRNQIEKIE